MNGPLENVNDPQNYRRGVVVVDDDKLDILFLTRALESCNMRPITTFESIATVEQFINGKGQYGDRQKFPLPKVMFIDITLPEGDSKNFLPAWRSILGSGTLIILVTGFVRPDALQGGFGRGADSFLEKPVSERTLKNLKAFYENFFASMA